MRFCPRMNPTEGALIFEDHKNFPKVAYDVTETARILSIGRTALYAQIKTGKLRATKLGRKTLILAKDLDAFVALLPKKEEQR